MVQVMSLWNWQEVPRPTKIPYRNTEYFVRINDTISEPIPVTTGVKHAGLPTFPHFVQPGLIEGIKKLGLGVKCGELILALLRFADDIALMAETEEDLQCMLNVLHSWCECWLLRHQY